MNGNLLRAEAVKRGFSIRDVARESGIKESTMYSKISHGWFTVGEALRIKKVLELPLQTFSDIFFDGYLS